MKYKTLFIVSMLVLTLFIDQKLCAILSLSQYKSDSFFQKPYFSQDDYTDLSFIFSGGFASQAYNDQGQKVPFLQQFGSENLLQQFIDPTASSTATFGQGLLDGNFHVRELIVSCYKNMNHGFFIESAIVLQDISMTQISIDFIPSPISITEDQLLDMQQLQQRLPATLDMSGMFTAAVYAGCSKTFLDFHHIDFVDITVKTGIMSPQSMMNSNSTLLQLPFYDALQFGYPVIGAVSFGLLDWITIGWNGSVVPWQTAVKDIPLNSTSSGNNLLVAQSGLAQINRGPLLQTGLYFQADHFYQGLSAMVAYSYTKSCSYSITPINTVQFSSSIVNQSRLIDTWSLGSLYLQFDVDFAYESKPNSPVISILCNIPTAGQLCPKTTLFGGNCSLQISYAF